MCSPDSGCDETCMNRYMQYECDNKNCTLGSLCTNRPFAELKARLSSNKMKYGEKFATGVEVVKTVDRGFGLRANRTFEPDQIIVEYTGEIITKEMADSRARNEYKDNEVRLSKTRFCTSTDIHSATTLWLSTGA